MTSPWRMDAQPFESVEEALTWGLHMWQNRGSGAYSHRFVPAAAGIPRPCEPIDIIKTCEMVAEKYGQRSDLRLIEAVAFGGLTAEQAASAEWRALESRLRFSFERKGIMAPDMPAPV
jgi:hypothetical protein